MATLEELEAAPVGNCMKKSKLVRDFKIHDSFAFPLVSAIFFKDSEPCWGDNTFQAHKHSFSQFFSQTMLIFPGRIKGQNDWLHCCLRPAQSSLPGGLNAHLSILGRGKVSLPVPGGGVR